MYLKFICNSKLQYISKFSSKDKVCSIASDADKLTVDTTNEDEIDDRYENTQYSNKQLSTGPSNGI